MKYSSRYIYKFRQNKMNRTEKAARLNKVWITGGISWRDKIFTTAIIL